MGKDEKHDRIIRRLCRELLLPYGIFEKGTSRIYIDDNGYYLTIIEFQPSARAKGTFLNVGLYFLWRVQDYFSYDFAVGGDCRIAGFAEYKTDEQFASLVKPYAGLAVKKALFYRSFADPDTAWRYFQSDRKNFIKTLSRFDSDIKDLPENTYLKALLERPDILRAIKEQRGYWRSKPSMKKLGFCEYDE